MPKTTIEWEWEEAFDKFGFGDGDGPNFTNEVANKLTDSGFEVRCDTWGIHNYMIFKIIDANKLDLLKDKNVGYDDPRDYLPANIVKILDETFT